MSCTEPGCTKPVRALGLCDNHYYRIYHKEWRKEHPEYKEQHRRWSLDHYYRNKQEILKRQAIRAKKAREKRKTIVLAHYSNNTFQCACCVENRREFLTIDHINGQGNQHRKSVTGLGNHFYTWLIKNNFPEGFRVLCMNCNFSYGHFGYCPHQMQKEQELLCTNLISP